jgi:(4S)-4-hydroxy-5-phosphonooxypentane-2,3-dione isomerase
VNILIRPDQIETFRAATLENAKASHQEPGIVRFDVLQSQDVSNRFLLVEVYRAPEDQELHRQTAHYLHWRDSVADMMLEPRTGAKYSLLFPEASAFEYPPREVK